MHRSIYNARCTDIGKWLGAFFAGIHRSKDFRIILNTLQEQFVIESLWPVDPERVRYISCRIEESGVDFETAVQLQRRVFRPRSLPRFWRCIPSIRVASHSASSRRN